MYARLRVCERPSHQLVLQAISRFLADFRAKGILLGNPNFTEKSGCRSLLEVLNPYRQRVEFRENVHVSHVRAFFAQEQGKPLVSGLNGCP